MGMSEPFDNLDEQVNKIARGFTASVSDSGLAQDTFQGPVTDAKLASILRSSIPNFIRSTFQHNALVQELAIALELSDILHNQMEFLIAQKKEMAQLIEKAEKEAQELQERFDQIDQELMVERQERFAETQLQEIQKQQANLTSSISELKAEIESTDEKIKEIETEIEKTDAEINQIQQKKQLILEEIKHLPRGGTFSDIEEADLKNQDKQNEIIADLVSEERIAALVGDIDDEELRAEKIAELKAKHTAEAREGFDMLSKVVEAKKQGEDGNFLDVYREAMGVVDASELFDEALAANREEIREANPQAYLNHVQPPDLKAPPLPKWDPPVIRAPSRQMNDVLGLKEMLALVYAAHKNEDVILPQASATSGETLSDDLDQEEPELSRKGKPPEPKPSSPKSESSEQQDAQADKKDSPQPQKKFQDLAQRALQMHRVASALQRVDANRHLEMKEKSLAQLDKQEAAAKKCKGDLQNNLGQVCDRRQSLDDAGKKLQKSLAEIQGLQQKLINANHETPGPQGKSA